MPVPPTSGIVCAPLGTPIPPGPYAISVSLPTWEDNVGFATEEKRVLNAIDGTGYPRFVIHKSIQTLAAIFDQKHGMQGAACFLFPTASIANQCRDYVLARPPDDNHPPAVHLMKISIDSKVNSTANEERIALYLAFVPEEASILPKAIWSHVGLGITNRMADRCLALLEDGITTCSAMKDWDAGCELTTKGPLVQNHGQWSDDPSAQTTCLLNGRKHNFIALTVGMIAKQALRRRIARLVTYEASSFGTINLFLNAFPPAPSVCFGFPYKHTLIIVQQWGPGHYFFDKGDKADIDNLESLFSSSDAPHILALFCEFPSNPLLQSPDLIRLRELADRYGFPIVIDDTIGNFVNVDLLPFADILVNSLTKAFTGQANVMGGSFILNPKSRYYSALKPKMEAMYEDSYWDDGAICMEHNSRDFAERLCIMNRNAEAVFITPSWKNTRSTTFTGGTSPDGREEATAFYDALPCAKCPSFGTNFTLACPYTVLAHLDDLKWAAACGVEEALVRISVGLEDRKLLVDWIKNSLKCAEEAVLGVSWFPLGGCADASDVM